MGLFQAPQFYLVIYYITMNIEYNTLEVFAQDEEVLEEEPAEKTPVMPESPEETSEPVEAPEMPAESDEELADETTPEEDEDEEDEDEEEF